MYIYSKPDKAVHFEGLSLISLKQRDPKLDTLPGWELCARLPAHKTAEQAADYDRSS